MPAPLMSLPSASFRGVSFEVSTSVEAARTRTTGLTTRAESTPSRRFASTPLRRNLCVCWGEEHRKGERKGASVSCHEIVGVGGSRGSSESARVAWETHPTPRQSATLAERNIRLGDRRLCIVVRAGCSARNEPVPIKHVERVWWLEIIESSSRSTFHSRSIEAAEEGFRK